MPQSVPPAQKNPPRSLEGNTIAIIREDDSVVLLNEADSESFYAIMTCVEDDPKNWNDFQSDWTRCSASNDAVACIDDLDWQTVPYDKLCANLTGSVGKLTGDHTGTDQGTSSLRQSNWIVIDLPSATILAGEAAPILDVVGRGPNSTAAIESEVMELSLAPWWKVEQSVKPERLVQRDRTSPVRLQPNRDVLWGKEWVDFLAKELSRIAKNGGEISQRSASKAIVAIHRAWLMTPRASLQNQTPREQIHIAKDWISSLQNSQRYRIEVGFEPIPLPMDFSGYKGAPFGKQEIIIYFDANRELLEYGFQWMIKNISSRKSKTFESSLNEALHKRLKRWLSDLDEGNLTPALVIQFERQRVPLMEMEVTHPDVCGCPICQFASSGALGPGLIIYDGHQLELDDDFAFSIYSTQEEWNEESGYLSDSFPEEDDLSEDSDAMEDDGSEGDGFSKVSSPDYEDRIWSTNTPEEANLSGSTGRALGLSFLFAEFMTEVETASRSNSNTQATLEKMMWELASLRVALESQSLPKAKASVATIKRMLEGLAGEFPRLVPRVSDLSSRLDEEVRRVSATH